MTGAPSLDDLIEQVKKRPPMTDAEYREQAKSFAYGNCAIGNPNVTRQMVEDALPPIYEEDVMYPTTPPLDMVSAVFLAIASVVSVATLLSVLYWCR